MQEKNNCISNLINGTNGQNKNIYIHKKKKTANQDIRIQ